MNSLKLPDLVGRYQRHYEKHEAVKHGRYTSSKYRVRAATNYLLEVVTAGPDLADTGREPTRGSAPTEDVPQLSLLAQDLPGGGGEPVRCLRDLHVEQLTRHDLRDYLAHLLSKRHESGRFKGKPWTAEHVNKYRQSVLKMIEWAEDEGLLSADVHHELKRAKPVRAGKTVARKSRRVQPAPAETLFALVEHLRSVAATMPVRTPAQRRRRRQRLLWAVAVELTWESGMRPIETVVLRPCDVRPSPLDPEVLEYEPSEFKTEHLDEAPRIVGFTSRARQLFEEAVGLWSSDGHQGTLTFATDYDPEARLFPWRAAHPYHARGGFTRRIQEELQAAGLPAMRTRQIRHAFLTRAAAIDVRLAQVGGGHRHYSTTENYVHGDDAARLELLARLEAGGDRPGPPAPPGSPSNPPGRSAAVGGGGSAPPPEAPFRLRLVGS
jgi:integrase